MSDLYDVLFGEKEDANKAFFFTDEEGRVRFAGGPGSGGGGSSGSPTNEQLEAGFAISPEQIENPKSTIEKGGWTYKISLGPKVGDNRYIFYSPTSGSGKGKRYDFGKYNYSSGELTANMQEFKAFGTAADALREVYDL
jgi:hypothetical protein